MEQKLIRVADVAKALSLSVTHTYELIGQGVIPSVRLGTAIRVPVDVLEAKLAQMQRGAVSSAA